MLTEHGYQYQELVMGKNVSFTSLKAISGAESWPQIFIGGKHIGDSDHLESFLSK
jgi:glutaredoxin